MRLNFFPIRLYYILLLSSSLMTHCVGSDFQGNPDTPRDRDLLRCRYYYKMLEKYIALSPQNQNTTMKSPSKVIVKETEAIKRTLRTNEQESKFFFNYLLQIADNPQSAKNKLAVTVINLLIEEDAWADITLLEEDKRVAGLPIFFKEKTDQKQKIIPFDTKPDPFKKQPLPKEQKKKTKAKQKKKTKAKQKKKTKAKQKTNNILERDKKKEFLQPDVGTQIELSNPHKIAQKPPKILLAFGMLFPFIYLCLKSKKKHKKVKKKQEINAFPF